MFRVQLTIELESADESEVTQSEVLEELVEEIESMVIYVDYVVEADEDEDESEEQAEFALTVINPRIVP